METATSVQGAGGRASTATTIQDFVTAVQEGCESWESAGKILVALHREDPDIFKRINKEFPFLNTDALELFYQIGIGSLYPMTLLLPRHVMSAARYLPYEKQKLLCSEPVQIVTRIVGGKPTVIRKPAATMSREDVKLAIGHRSIFTVERQVARMNHATRINHATFPAALPTPLPAEMKRVPKVLAKVVIQRGVGGRFIMEPTTATPYNVQRLLLEGGKAVVELTAYDNGEEL